MASGCSSIGVIVRPRELSKESDWSFTQASSVYSFFIRIIETTFSGVQFKADLRVNATLSVPQEADLDDEIDKLENRVEVLLHKELEKFPDIFDLSDHLTRTLFRGTNNPQETIEFKLRA